MSHHPAKRLRRLSNDYDKANGGDGWALKDKGAHSSAASAAPTASSTRPRRNTANKAPPAAVIQRSSPEESRQTLNLTVKASPGKLRDATGGRSSTAVSSRNIVSGKRASRNSRVVREVDSDDEEDEDEDEAEEVDAMDVDDDEEEEEEEDEDAEGEEDEDMDAEGEEDDETELTPAPRIVVPSNKSVPVKQKVAQDSVEAKEMAMDDDDDDDELSELDSDLEGEDEDVEGEDEDAEGEEDDEIAVPNDDEDEEMESDDDLSRDQTPDLSKMTRRQQAMVVQGADESLMALSNEAQKKKHLTAEEITSRRAEMARRRKNLSEKRNEEEKMDTINRLLKKQPPKRGRRVIQEVTESGQEEEPEPEKPNPLFVRYRQNASGTTLAIPDEWLQAPAGSLFTGTLAQPSSRPYSGRMVEEVS